MSDKELYLFVEEEIANGNQDPALLSKAKIKSEENNLSINANYTNLRVEELSALKRKDKAIEMAVNAKETSISIFKKSLPYLFILFLCWLLLGLIAINQGW